MSIEFIAFILLMLIFWFVPFAFNDEYFLTEDIKGNHKYDWRRMILSITPILNIWTFFKYKVYK